MCLLPSRRWSIRPHPLSVGYTWALPSKEHNVERGETCSSDFIMEKPNKRYVSHEIKVNITHAPLLWCDENGTSPPGSSSPKPITTSSHENIGRIPIEWQSAKYLTCNPQQCHQKQERCENVTSKKSPRKHDNLIHNVVTTDIMQYPGWDPVQKKDLREKWGNLNQVRILVINNVAILIYCHKCSTLT